MSTKKDLTNRQVHVSRAGDVVRVDFTDSELTGDDYISDMRIKIEQVAIDTPRAKVVLNFANIAHLSSAAIGELIRAHRLLKQNEGSLHISRPQPSVMDIFEITRLNHTLNFCDTDPADE